MTELQWFQWAKEGGAYIAPFLLGALIWMSQQWKREREKSEEKDAYLRDIAQQAITLNAEIKTFLFSERKAS